MEDFSSNLNPYGPPERTREYVLSALSHLNHYPDDDATLFREAIRSRYKVSLDNITVGAGSAELIKLFPQVLLSPGDKVLMPKPTFSEYAFSCHLRGCQVVEVPLISNNGQRIDIDSMRRQLPGTKAAYICNPNNPSGSILSREAVMEFAEECARHGTILFLDETLLELVQGWEGITCLPEVDRLDNLFIIRSLTKCFAIPGIRIGYGVGSAPLISSLEGSRLSWNLGQIEIAVGSNLLRNDYAYIQRAAEMMAKEKVQLTHRLVDIGLVRPTLPDSFFFFSPCVRTGAWLQEQLLHHKVLIRDCSSFGAPYSSYVRFAVKRPEQNDRLIAAMEAVAKKVP